MDAISALLHRHTHVPGHLMQEDATKTGLEFDVNEYFSALNHLSMAPGYALDYVYHYDLMGGEPVLYGRPENQLPYPTYSHYVEVEGEIAYPDRLYRFTDTVQVDGTAEGFFQLIVLRLMGGQFYQYWHGDLNDTIIVCDRASAEAALSATYQYTEPPVIVWLRLRTLDFEPRVDFENGTVSVRLVTFTKRGGFIERTYVIDRHFPHQVLFEELKTLVPCCEGIPDI